MNKPDKIIVHHTAVSRNHHQFRSVNEYHRSRGFPISSRGYYCGYHILIERDGTRMFPRAFSDNGAHTIGQNFSSIGIGLAGNFNVEKPSKQQVEKLGKTIFDIMGSFNIPINRVYPHRTFSNTSCYGTLLKDKWARQTVIQYQVGLLAKILLWLKIAFGQLKKG